MRCKALSQFGAALLLIAACGCGCRGKGPVRPTSLLLISIDTLRADHVHAYGYARETTPNIDALARSGVRFSRAWSHSPWTLPSHATLLSGTHPFRHGVVEDGMMLDDSVPLIAPLLKTAGYSTAAVVSGFYVSSQFGFQRGFDSFEDFGLPKGLRDRKSVKGEEITALAARRIQEAAGKPFFLFTHYFDAHNDYDPPEPWNRWFDESTRVVPYVNYQYYKSHALEPRELAHVIAQYDEEIRYTDEMVGQLLGALEKAGRLEDTLIVLTSDHGEELFEHGSWGHGNSLYSQVLRVPLLLAGPGVAPGRVVNDFVRHEDLAPTLLELLAQPHVDAFEGRSYASKVRSDGPPQASGLATRRGTAGTDDGGAGAGRPISSGGSVLGQERGEGRGDARLLLAETSRFLTNLVGVVDETKALILDLAAEKAELYDLEADPSETHNLLDSTTRDGLEAGNLKDALVKAVLASVPERWVITWDTGITGCVRVNGMILDEQASSRTTRDGPEPGGEDPKRSRAGTHSERSPYDPRALAQWKEWHLTSSKREARVASVPPDAPVEIFVTEIGSTKGSCGWDSEGRRRPASERTGRFYVLDPVRDGARLRKSPPVFLEPPDAGHAKGSAEGQKGVHVRIESKRRAVTPTNLTPEQRERLRSLGYLQ